MSNYHITDNEVLELADTVLRYWLTTKNEGTENETQMCRYCRAIPTDGAHKHYCPTIIASKIKRESFLAKESNDTNLDISDYRIYLP